MIRANLMPRRNEDRTIPGLRPSVQTVHEGLMGLTVIGAVTLLGTIVEQSRIHRLTAALSLTQGIIALHVADTAGAKKLGLEVARFRTLVHKVQYLQRSGGEAVMVIAHIGNALPPGVYVDRISSTHSGYQVIGRSRTFAEVRVTIASLGSARSGGAVSLTRLRRHTEHEARFSAHIAVSTLPPDELSRQ